MPSGGNNGIPVPPPPPPLPPNVSNGTTTETAEHVKEVTPNQGETNKCDICNGTVDIYNANDDELNSSENLTRRAGDRPEELKAWRNVMIVAAFFTLFFNIIPHFVSMKNTLLYRNRK